MQFEVKRELQENIGAGYAGVTTRPAPNPSTGD